MKCKHWKAFILITFILLVSVLSASADDHVHVVYGETYYCGDSFEVIIQDEPVTTSMVTRSAPRGKIVQAKAGKHETLFVIHLKLRNMTNTVYRGLSPESFKLIGYVRGFPVIFTPEIMEPYDYGSRKTYTVYDMNYYLKNQFAPLHQIDMLLVFRVKPFLRDWELQIEPQWNDGAKKSYYFANYPDEEDENVRLCNGTFQFLSIGNIQ